MADTREHLIGFYAWLSDNDGGAIADAPGLVDEYLSECSESATEAREQGEALRDALISAASRFQVMASSERHDFTDVERQKMHEEAASLLIHAKALASPAPSGEGELRAACQRLVDAHEVVTINGGSGWTRHIQPVIYEIIKLLRSHPTEEDE